MTRPGVTGPDPTGAKSGPASGSWQDRAEARRIVGLLEDFSIESLPATEKAVASLGETLRPGAPVYVVSPPARTQSEVVETAVLLDRAGFRPVPHVAARSFADRDRLADYLWRLTSRARVDRVLLVGGNRRKPIGEFETALDVLETGLFQEFGIRRVGLAGHPEGHPEVAADVIAAALRDKIAYGREAGLEMHVVTQFCFDPHVVIDWVAELQSDLGPVPVHVGVPGPGSLTSLVRFARMCKIGDSVRFLTRGAGKALLLANWTPDKFLTALAYYTSVNPDCGIDRLHFYSFGGTLRTAKWLAAVCKGDFAMHSDGRGFSLNAKAPRG